MDKRRSLEALEKRQATIVKKNAEAKARLRANKLKPKQELSETDRAVRDMAAAYEEALSEYRGESFTRIFTKRLVPGVKWYAILARAVEFANEMELDFETYIKGLFYVADKWGNRAPKIQELSDYKTKMPAKDRVALFLKEQPSKSSKVVGILQPKIEIPQAVKSMNSERQLRAFMRNLGLTEEQVLQKFAMTSDYVNYFDRKWLMGHPTYQHLKEQYND